MRFKRLKSDKKRKYPLVIKLSFITVCVGIGGMITWRLAAEERFYQRSIIAYETHNISQYNEFREYLMPMTNQRFQRYLEKQAKQLLERYSEQEISFEAVRDQIQRLQSFAYNPQAFEPYQAQLKEEHRSRQAFQQGEMSAKNKDWKQARVSYLQVTPTDPNYGKAQRALQQISRWEVDAYLIQAITAFEEERMKDALADLEEGLSNYPDNRDLLRLKQDIENAINSNQHDLPEHWNRWKSALEERVDQTFQGVRDKLQNFGDWLKKILP